MKMTTIEEDSYFKDPKTGPQKRAKARNCHNFRLVFKGFLFVFLSYFLLGSVIDLYSQSGEFFRKDCLTQLILNTVSSQLIQSLQALKGIGTTKMTMLDFAVPTASFWVMESVMKSQILNVVFGTRKIAVNKTRTSDIASIALAKCQVGL